MLTRFVGRCSLLLGDMVPILRESTSILDQGGGTRPRVHQEPRKDDGLQRAIDVAPYLCNVNVLLVDLVPPAREGPTATGPMDQNRLKLLFLRLSANPTVLQIHITYHQLGLVAQCMRHASLSLCSVQQLVIKFTLTDDHIVGSLKEDDVRMLVDPMRWSVRALTISAPGEGSFLLNHLGRFPHLEDFTGNVLDGEHGESAELVRRSYSAFVRRHKATLRRIF